MELLKARLIAEKYLEFLRPHCIKAEIAGSIRREKSEVKDIEICCIEKSYQSGLFEDGIAQVVNQWQKIKGELEYGKCKYTQRLLLEGINLDLFFANEDNWGNIFLIRTGDWEFSKHFMGTLLPQRGYKQENGFLTYNDKIIPCHDEMILFERVGLEFIEPEKRNLLYLKQISKT